MAKILIADDAKFMRLTLQAMLSKNTHEIIGEAVNGEEAIKLFKELRPELITMDITMPVVNGIDAIKEIMRLDPDANIIVCSAMGQQKVVVEAIEAGAKDFIVKPFDERNVLATISRVLNTID
ncbi:two-component system response regulator [Oceanobacillus zhaokaii]|uniref:Two-component system response regulator n=1 Tax=Oceanobacillus zhaokaii TaxID=2052660 RepID=A0A345PGR5_9BACI|nr:response regulator [Oceanobacillus zhaokaii]AXI09195.1 two-component system response regulator [Oceanobacillus zhaokaii]